MKNPSVLKKLVLSIVFTSFVSEAQLMTDLKKTVVFVYGEAEAKDNNGKTVKLSGAIGTAFIVGYPDLRGGPDYAFMYAVTAKHVLKDDSNKYLDKVRIRFNNINGSGVGFADLAVADAKGNLIWLEDTEDQNADVAAILAYPNPHLYDYRAVPVSMFTSDKSLKQANVIEGDAVYLVGLMPQFTGVNRNYPVVRHGYLALLTDEPIPLGPKIKEKVFALELGSWPGQSGSPVFLSLGGIRGGAMYLGESYSLLGIMLGYFGNIRPFDVSQTDSVMIGDSSNIGISFVLPASEILKVLDSAVAQRQRDAIIEDLKRHPTPVK